MRARPLRARKQVADLSLTLLARGGGAPFGLAANVVLARLLGPSNFGRYMTLLSAGLVAGGLAIYGTAPVITREIASQRVHRQTDALGAVLRWAISVMGPITAVILLLLILWLRLAAGAPSSSWEEDIAVFLLVPLSAVGYTQNAILAGLHRVAQGQFLGNLWKNGWLLVGALVLLLGGQPWTTDALWIQVASYGCLALLGVWLIRRALAAYAGVAQRSIGVTSTFRPEGRRWFASATSFFAFSIATLLFMRLDVIIVNEIAGNVEAGLFGVAARVIQVAQIPGLVWLAWLQPKLAYQSGQEEIARMRQTFLGGFAGVTGITLIVIICSWIFAPSIMQIFGTGFAAAVSPFRWLSLGYLSWAMAVPSLAILTMTGREKVVATAIWSQLFIAVGLALILVRHYGATGGACAWAAGLVASDVFLIIVGFVVAFGPSAAGERGVQ